MIPGWTCTTSPARRASGSASRSGPPPASARSVLELGGKSANIVYEDADLDLATQSRASAMCMSNSGQGCALATRMVVHAPVYDEVLTG